MGDGGFLRHFRSFYRHSRVSGNPTVVCRQYHHKTVPFGIPAYAGMTVKGPPDSRLRGKDGRGRREVRLERGGNGGRGFIGYNALALTCQNPIIAF